MSHHSHLPPELDEAVRSFIRRHKRGLRWCCLVAVCVLLLLGVAVVWGLFGGVVRLKDWVVGSTPAIRLPLEWERPLGDAAVEQLRRQFRFTTDPRLTEPLGRLAAPLFATATNSSDRFTLFVAESKDVNAFALPGGYIVFHRGLLERARSSEEVQGVLAHEMAQVLKRHGVLQLAKNIGLNVAIQQIQGGENRVLDALVRDSGQLLGLNFSRDAERAADDLGWDLLQRAEIDPGGMLSFFAALKAEIDVKGAAGLGSGGSLLSTHPTPQERIDRLRQKQEAMVPREFKPFDDDFAALEEGLRRPQK